MKTSVRAAVEVMFQRRASVSHSGSTVDKSRYHSSTGGQDTFLACPRSIKLANLNPGLEDILQITKVFTVFEVFERAEDAAAALNSVAGQSAPEEW
jgi:hypothetical protein